MQIRSSIARGEESERHFKVGFSAELTNGQAIQLLKLSFRQQEGVLALGKIIHNVQKVNAGSWRNIFRLLKKAGRTGVKWVYFGSIKSRPRRGPQEMEFLH